MYLEPNWPLFRGVTNFHGHPSTSLFIDDSSSMVLVLQEGLLHRSYSYGPVEVKSVIFVADDQPPGF